MEWIYDHTTPHSRLMVGYDRYGITIRQWSDEVPDDETGFSFQEGYFTWEQWRAADHGWKPRMKDRIVGGAISLLCAHGGSSDDEGIVPDTDTYINTGHRFTC